MEKENNNSVKNKITETYASDMAKAINGNEGSYVRKIIKEQEEHENENLNLSPESRKNRYLMFIGFFLLISAMGVLVFLLFFREQILTVSIPAQFTPLVYLDDTEFKDIGGLTKDQIAQNTFNDVSLKEIKTGGVLGIYLTLEKKIVGLRKFLTLISPDFDQSKINFADDNFLIGITNTGEKNLFILVKTRSMADIFDAVHSWEDKIFYDLHGFFGTQVTADTKYLLMKNFEDKIVQNRNARVLRDDNGKLILMYVFANDTSLIITNSEATASEVMLRLSSSMIRR